MGRGEKDDNNLINRIVLIKKVKKLQSKDVAEKMLKFTNLKISKI